LDGAAGFPATIAVDSIKTVAKVNCKNLSFNGRFLSATSWRDRLGHNILILSEKGNYADGNGRKELFAYHYTQRDTARELLWQMNDYVDGKGCDLDIQLIHFFPQVSDVDTNGIAETAIFYALNNRCDASIFPAKLIVHEGAVKFVIRGVRGQFLGSSEAVLNVYRAEQGLPALSYKNLDTASAELDASIVDFYSQKWDEFITLENELNGALPDSLVTLID